MKIKIMYCDRTNNKLYKVIKTLTDLRKGFNRNWKEVNGMFGRFSHFYEEFQNYVNFKEGQPSDDSYELPIKDELNDQNEENKVSDEFLDKAIKYEVQKLSTKMSNDMIKANSILPNINKNTILSTEDDKIVNIKATGSLNTRNILKKNSSMPNIILDDINSISESISSNSISSSTSNNNDIKMFNDDAKLKTSL